MTKFLYFLLVPPAILLVRAWHGDPLAGLVIAATLLGVAWFIWFRVMSKYHARLAREEAHLRSIGRWPTPTPNAEEATA